MSTSGSITDLLKPLASGFTNAGNAIAQSVTADLAPKPYVEAQCKLIVGYGVGQYICAEGGGGANLIANRTAIGSWETFALLDRGNGQVALQASNGQYVCAEGGGGQNLVANRTAIGSWETFKLIDCGNGQVALQASNGQYVCAEGGGGQNLIANRTAIGSWETFNLIDQGTGLAITAAAKSVGPVTLQTSMHPAQNRYQVVLIARRGNGSVITGSTLTLFANEDMTIEQHQLSSIVSYSVGPNTPLKFTASASGRCCFTIAPPSDKLTVPVLKVQSDGMASGNWSVFSPDTDLHQQLAGATGSQLLATPQGKSAPLLPASTSLPDANALASAASQLMKQCITYSIATVASTSAVSFAAAEESPRNASLTPVSCPSTAGSHYVPHVVGIDPATPVLRVLGSTPSAPPAGGAGPGEPAPLSFSDSLADVFKTAGSTITSVVTTAAGTIAGGATTAAGTIASGAGLPSNIVGGVDSLTNAITAAVKSAGTGAAQFLDTASAAAQILVKSIDTAVVQPVENFASDTVASAKQIAIDTSKGFTVLAAIMENGVLKAVKTFVTDVESAAKVTAAFFKRVGAEISSIIDFFASLFAWDDILATKEFLAQQLNRGITYLQTPTNTVGTALQTQLNTVGTALHTQLTSLKSKIGDSLDLAKTTLGSKAATSNPKPANPIASILVQAQWLMNHVSDNASKATLSATSSASASPALQTALTTIQTRLGNSDVVDAISKCGTFLQNSLSDPSTLPSLALGALIDLLKSIATVAIDVVDVICQAIISLISDALQALLTLLTAPITIPFVSSFYKDVISGGSALTLLDLCALIGAIPVTIIYKLLSNNQAPFKVQGNTAVIAFADPPPPWMPLGSSEDKTTLHWNIIIGALMVPIGIIDPLADWLSIVSGVFKSASGETFIGALLLGLSILTQLFNAPGSADSWTNLAKYGDGSSFTGLAGGTDAILWAVGWFAIGVNAILLVSGDTIDNEVGRAANFFFGLAILNLTVVDYAAQGTMDQNTGLFLSNLAQSLSLLQKVFLTPANINWVMAADVIFDETAALFQILGS